MKEEKESINAVHFAENTNIEMFTMWWAIFPLRVNVITKSTYAPR